VKNAVRAEIIRAANEVGMDPSLALAIAERESSFRPDARNSSTIRGLYQMQGGHRARYGIGDSNDPYAQTKGWAAFFRDVQKEMGSAAIPPEPRATSGITSAGCVPGV
jgi:soluble lytic murein transglycosylase-like protein